MDNKTKDNSPFRECKVASLNKILKPFLKLCLKFRIFIYKWILSDCRVVKSKKVKINQPALFVGDGKIFLKERCHLGYFPSAYFYSTYCHLETRGKDSSITIGEKTMINNNCNIVAADSDIEIGKNCVIGQNFKCFSSDFHGIKKEDRNNPEKIKTASVKIGNDVFIGSDVTVLKGVTIGDGCVIAAGSIVTKSFEANSIIAGNPAQLKSMISD